MEIKDLHRKKWKGSHVYYKGSMRDKRGQWGIGIWSKYLIFRHAKWHNEPYFFVQLIYVLNEFSVINQRGQPPSVCNFVVTWCEGKKGGGGAQTPCPSRTCLLCAYQTDLWQKYSEKTIFKNRGKRHTNPNWGEHTDLGLLLSNPHVWERGSFGGHRSLSKCQTQKNSLTARNLKVWVEVQMMPGEWKLPTNPTLSGVL